MREELKMKRILPIALFVGAFCSFMIGQILWDLKASQSQQHETESVLYNQLYAKHKSVFEEKLKEGFNKKFLIINFWASWCLPCLEEIPSLVELGEGKRSSEVAIIGISTDDFEGSKKYAMTFKKLENKLSQYNKKWENLFPTLFDEKSLFVTEFKIEAIPATIIYKNGKFFKSFKGKVDFSSSKLLD
jgi:thiol-disulfide isomerase/thioredoxin